MKQAALFGQIITAVLLTTCILIQSQSTGLGKSSAWSGGLHTKRGAEKVLFIATIVLAVLFLSFAIINVI